MVTPSNSSASSDRDRDGGDRDLSADVERLGLLLDEIVAARAGGEALALLSSLRADAIALRAGTLSGGRAAFAARMRALDLPALEACAHTFTQYFHLVNVAEEQHRIRVLRRRDREGAAAPQSMGAACAELRAGGIGPDEVRALLGRLFIMPVLTAHPTEARRRSVLDHLADLAAAIDGLDDPRAGASERARLAEELREAALALYCTEHARTTRPTPLDEVRAGLDVFDRTLLDATLLVYRNLEEALAATWPGESFEVPPFLRFGTWIGGDRDGNPNVTAEVTRVALERARRLAIDRHLRDVDALGRELSLSARRVPPSEALVASLKEDRARLPEVAARAYRYVGEPWREKLWYVRARLRAARDRAEGGYADVRGYLDDLALLDASLDGPGLGPVRGGKLRDARRRAEVFGFHLATMDLRQHSAVHEAAVAELLGRAGAGDYAAMDERARVALLGQLLDRAELRTPVERAALSPSTRELLSTLEVVGRARRDSGPATCERYVVSFTRSVSDLLEVLFLARAAHLAPDELRPIPLLEQLEDLERAREIADGMLAVGPIRAAIGSELEVMVGYSDSSKQAGYVASQVALVRAQEDLARVADARGVTLTVFHGRGGAIGRGGGPANRAIRAQPPEALRGRLRVTEQGETITARYGRLAIAERDLEQMVHAVLVASTSRAPSAADVSARDRTMTRAAQAARAAYEALIADRERLARYATAATPIVELAELPIASRPASRRPGLSFDDLRAIPWVFSWAQSRHGVPGWYGLGTALQAIREAEGEGRARELYARWPFFQALVDNAQIALVRADMDVAASYAGLAEPEARAIFDEIRREHDRTVEEVLRVTGEAALLAAWPTIARTVRRRNPFVDLLSHAQIELLARLRASATEAERDRLRAALFTTINGIAAGLQTAG
jgi:phosphoenolpyruvate carboxylase